MNFEDIRTEASKTIPIIEADIRYHEEKIIFHSKRLEELEADLEEQQGMLKDALAWINS